MPDNWRVIRGYRIRPLPFAVAALVVAVVAAGVWQVAHHPNRPIHVAGDPPPPDGPKSRCSLGMIGTNLVVVEWSSTPCAKQLAAANGPDTGGDNRVSWAYMKVHPKDSMICRFHNSFGNGDWLAVYNTPKPFGKVFGKSLCGDFRRDDYWYPGR
jgi:hypothetical protein